MRNDHSCLFKQMYEHGSLCRIELLSVSLSVARVELAQGDEFDAICARMETLRDELGTQLKHERDSLVWSPERHASQGEPFHIRCGTNT